MRVSELRRSFLDITLRKAPKGNFCPYGRPSKIHPTSAYPYYPHHPFLWPADHQIESFLIPTASPAPIRSYQSLILANSTTSNRTTILSHHLLNLLPRLAIRFIYNINRFLRLSDHDNDMVEKLIDRNLINFDPKL